MLDDLLRKSIMILEYVVEGTCQLFHAIQYVSACRDLYTCRRPWSNILVSIFDILYTGIYEHTYILLDSNTP